MGLFIAPEVPYKLVLCLLYDSIVTFSCFFKKLCPCMYSLILCFSYQKTEENIDKNPDVRGFKGQVVNISGKYEIWGTPSMFTVSWEGIKI